MDILLYSYKKFVEKILRTEPSHLKYLDESTYDPRKFNTKAWLPKRSKNQLSIDRSIGGKSVIVTILTSVDDRDDEVTLDIRVNTNNQYNFLDFILSCVNKQVLRSGDVIVLDNASIHRAKEIRVYLFKLLRSVGCSILYMPTYSPELNPCELVFAQTKKQVSRLWHTTNLSLERCVLLSFVRINKNNVINYYRYCRYLEFLDD